MLPLPLALLAVTQHEGELAHHEAVFTVFCDTGSVADGDCWCKGGGSTSAIGDGSWLWHQLVGQPCEAQPDDRCDCASCGGATDDCPHEGCWQCQGINAPQCNPTEELKRCEVEVHGTHGAEKYYITEVCPSRHPCNRSGGFEGHFYFARIYQKVPMEVANGQAEGSVDGVRQPKPVVAN